MKLFVKALLIGGVFAVSWPGYAATDRCGLRDDLHRIERGIDHGVNRGSLTPGEVRRLERQRREIRRLARDLREENGRLTRRDCRILDSEVRRLDRKVTRLKHNDRRVDYEHGRHYRR